MSAGKRAIRKISRGFQVTLPKGFRERYGLNEGDYLEASEEKGAVVYRPVVIDRKKLLAEMNKTFIKLDKIEDDLTGMAEDKAIDIVIDEIRRTRAGRRKKRAG